MEISKGGYVVGSLIRVILVGTAFWLVMFSAFFSQLGLSSQPAAFDRHSLEALLSLGDIKGVWYLGWTQSAYASDKLSEELVRLKTALGVQYVGLIVPLVQDSLSALNPHPDPSHTPSRQTLGHAIEEARRLGLGVVLLPYLLVESERRFEGKVIEDWVGDLAPTDVGIWFENWREILRDYAVLAEEEGVEAMLLGWEFESMLSYQDEWQQAIVELRELYSGKLSYLTNWWASRDEYERVLRWSPWQSLDFIGISAYFDLTRKNDPTVEELESAWHEDANGQDIVKDLERLSAQYDRRIVFWELGYQSKDGANQAPWNYVWPGSPDAAEQADAFSAAFSVLSNKPWFAGYLIWGEEVGLPQDPYSYSLLGKAVESRIRAHRTALREGHPVAREEAGLTFYKSDGKGIGMFSNTVGTVATGLHVEFDRQVTITHKTEFGGYLPAQSEKTAWAFDFVEGTLVAGGTVELDWTPAEARPILIQWLSGSELVGDPYLALPQEMGRMLSEGIAEARKENPELVTAALARFFGDNTEFLAALNASLGVSLQEWLPPLLMAASPAGIENFFNALIETLGVRSLEMLRDGEADLSALFSVLDPVPSWLGDSS